ncbi:hypothetical protein EVAR_58972_1 [Eumeta japonica]|uniref:Uncharacterized protein n=1 Tax=Eumeta variegata TaxID=151549 RepID=A0A4C1YDL3_EUMVA|nr:hypothetical protein EVAR_58972_1 [Eumeta japonica]
MNRRALQLLLRLFGVFYSCAFGIHSTKVLFYKNGERHSDTASSSSSSSLDLQPVAMTERDKSRYTEGSHARPLYRRQELERAVYLILARILNDTWNQSDAHWPCAEPVDGVRIWIDAENGLFDLTVPARPCGTLMTVDIRRLKFKDAVK